MTLTTAHSISRSKLLLGSPWSSFTEAAQRMSGGIEVRIIGKDFGT